MVRERERKRARGRGRERRKEEEEKSEKALPKVESFSTHECGCFSQWISFLLAPGPSSKDARSDHGIELDETRLPVHSDAGKGD